jgi:hypothetical protein
VLGLPDRSHTSKNLLSSHKIALNNSFITFSIKDRATKQIMFIGPFLVVYILRYLSLRDLASMSSSPSSHHHIHGIIRLGPPNKCLETETSPSHEINHICVILANRLRVINWLILPLLVYLLFLWSKYFLTYVVMLLCLLAKHSYYITSIDGYSKFTWFICLRKF